jgi:hypothetical protein
MDAYLADNPSSMHPYYNQKDLATSLREAYAEAFARYYGRDPTFGSGPHQGWSHMYQFMENNDAGMRDIWARAHPPKD